MQKLRLFVALHMIFFCGGVLSKNSILFLGDGMGITTISAARIFEAQQKKIDSFSNFLSFESFPNTALIRTHSADAQIPDSAATMSSIMTGIKTNTGMIGVGPIHPRGECKAVTQDSLPTLVELAEEAGLATGLISTSRITDATPAAAYAHVPDRKWETDSKTPPNALMIENCGDIARQMLTFNKGDGIDIVMGGGRENFFSRDFYDTEYPKQKGWRLSKIDLVSEWIQKKSGRKYIWNAEQFDRLNADSRGQILGLFEPKEMLFEAERRRNPGNEPSLSEMTNFAVRYLQNLGSERGFFLIVEAARIDHGNHFKNPYLALTETIELSEAVRQTLALSDLNETLIMVTADHSSSLAFTGYPEKEMLVQASLSYPSFTFRGDGFQSEHMNKDAEQDVFEYDPSTQPSPHAGEDVPAYATGIGAEAVRGTLEQNALFEILKSVILP